MSLNTSDRAMRIAYLINQYPAVSHSFIRREILALERQGFEVMRISLRRWDQELVDPQDNSEGQRTRYALKGGILALTFALARRPSGSRTARPPSFGKASHPTRTRQCEQTIPSNLVSA